MAVFRKELFAVSVECAALRWNLDKVLSKLKGLETELGEFMKTVSERTTESSSMMLKQFEIEVTLGLQRIFTEFKYEAAKN